LKLINKS